MLQLACRWPRYLHTINAAGGHLAFTREIQPEPYTASRLQRELGDATWNRLERRTQEDLIHGELFFSSTMPAPAEGRMKSPRATSISSAPWKTSCTRFVMKPPARAAWAALPGTSAKVA